MEVLINIIGVGAVILLLFFLFRSIGRLKGVQEKDIVFNRSEYVNWVAEGKRRLDNLTIIDTILGKEGYDTKAIKSLIFHETGGLSAPNINIHNNNIVGLEVYGEPGKTQEFKSVNNCLIAFDKLISGASRYERAYTSRRDGIEFIRQLNLGGYNTSIHWLNSIVNIYEDW